MRKKVILGLSVCLSLLLTNCGSDDNDNNTTVANANQSDDLTSTEVFNNKRIAVGKKIFFDPNMSTPAGQSCSSCHTPESGFADPNGNLPVSLGANTNLKGNRNAPTSAYTAHIPEFHYDEKLKDYVGGQFLDGRAKTLAEQAKGPLLNVVEMGNKSKREIIDKVEKSNYIQEIYAIYGKDTFQDDTETAYDIVANLLASYEKSEEMNAFNSKYDYYIEGKVELTAQEEAGLKLFNGKGRCSLCHNSSVPDDAGHNGAQQEKDGHAHPLFSTYRYYNLGLSNPDGDKLNPDLGLGATLNDDSQNGKFKVATLRNIALTAPYMHNGSLKTLKEVIEFYNTRDIDRERWGDPEVAENIDQDGIGNLGLTSTEIGNIIAFLKTLTDGYKLK